MAQHATVASYWTSFCTFLIGYCEQFFTLPNFVMLSAIFGTLATFAFNQYWQYRKDRREERALAEGLERRQGSRRAEDNDFLED